MCKVKICECWQVENRPFPQNVSSNSGLFWGRSLLLWADSNNNLWLPVALHLRLSGCVECWIVRSIFSWNPEIIFVAQHRSSDSSRAQQCFLLSLLALGRNKGGKGTEKGERENEVYIMMTIECNFQVPPMPLMAACPLSKHYIRLLVATAHASSCNWGPWKKRTGELLRRVGWRKPWALHL